MSWDIWLILLVLAVIVPWRGRHRLRELLAKPVVAGSERVSLYASTIAFQWLACGVAAWRCWANGFTATQLGLSSGGSWPLGIEAILGGLALGTFQWCNLRRMARMPDKTRTRVRAMAERILPQSRSELVAFLGLAVTAGLCEEFLYRGFAMAALAEAGLPLWGVVVISSILFGTAHLYQGRSGLLGTMLLGLVFGVVRAATGSLIPVATWHIAVDVVAGIAGPRYLIDKKLVTDRL